MKGKNLKNDNIRAMQTARVIPLKPILNIATGNTITSLLLQQLWYISNKYSKQVCRFSKFIESPSKKKGETNHTYWKRVKSYYQSGTSLSEELRLSPRQIRYNLHKICCKAKDKHAYESFKPLPDEPKDALHYFQDRLKGCISYETRCGKGRMTYFTIDKSALQKVFDDLNIYVAVDKKVDIFTLYLENNKWEGNYDHLCKTVLKYLHTNTDTTLSDVFLLDVIYYVMSELAYYVKLNYIYAASSEEMYIKIYRYLKNRYKPTNKLGFLKYDFTWLYMCRTLGITCRRPHKKEDSKGMHKYYKGYVKMAVILEEEGYGIAEYCKWLNELCEDESLTKSMSLAFTTTMIEQFTNNMREDISG